jgi:uncharacterized membrane-anchored protein
LLRPWDPGIAAIAAHSYAELLDQGIPAVTREAQSWSRLEVQAYPASVPGLLDAATAAAADGESTRAARLIERAIRLQPHDQQLARKLLVLRGGLGRSHSVESRVR